MIVTDRDRIILKHIEDYGFITIQQANMLVYNNLSYGYNYARERLKKLSNEGIVNCKRSPFLDRNVYYFDEKESSPKLHKTLIMDYYCNLINSGADIKYFEKEKKWLDGKVRSDAFAIYELGNTRFYNILEVNVSNNKLNLERYMDIIDEFHNDYNSDKTILPTVILVDRYNKKIESIENTFEVIPLKYTRNYYIDEFSKIFV